MDGETILWLLGFPIDFPRLSFVPEERFLNQKKRVIVDDDFLAIVKYYMLYIICSVALIKIHPPYFCVYSKIPRLIEDSAF